MAPMSEHRKPIDKFTIVADGEQSAIGHRMLERMDEFRAPGRDVLKLIDENVFVRADETTTPYNACRSGNHVLEIDLASHLVLPLILAEVIKNIQGMPAHARTQTVQYVPQLGRSALIHCPCTTPESCQPIPRIHL